MTEHCNTELLQLSANIRTVQTRMLQAIVCSNKGRLGGRLQWYKISGLSSD